MQSDPRGLPVPDGEAANLTPTLSRKEVIQMLDDGIPEALRADIGTLDGLVHNGKHLTLKAGTRCTLYLCSDSAVWMYWYREGTGAGRFCVCWELVV